LTPQNSNIVFDVEPAHSGPTALNKPHRNLPTTFGFISVQEIEGLGHCGGLLIVSQIGRPLEFHCSAPIANNRAQRILYGDTYDSFLLCEQIGLSLIDKAKAKPQIFIANCGELLDLNDLLPTPVVVLENDTNKDFFQPRLTSSDIQPAKRHGSFDFSGQTIWCNSNDPHDIRSYQEVVNTFTQTLTLDEPFERIEKAIDEAQAVAPGK
jgi:hypothetical protein